MVRKVVATFVGYLFFAVPAALLFALSGQDPHLVPSAWFAIVSTLYGMLFASLGGWVAATICRKDELKVGLYVAVVIGLVALFSLLVQWGKGSAWSQVVAFVLIAPSALVGSWIRHRSKKDTLSGGNAA